MEDGLDFSRPNRKLDRWIQRNLFAPALQPLAYSGQLEDAWKIMSHYFKCSTKDFAWRFVCEGIPGQKRYGFEIYGIAEIRVVGKNECLTICEAAYKARMEGVI